MKGDRSGAEDARVAGGDTSARGAHAGILLRAVPHDRRREPRLSSTAPILCTALSLDEDTPYAWLPKLLHGRLVTGQNYDAALLTQCR